MFDKNEILKKVENDVDLSDVEYKYYLMQILNHTEREADSIIAIKNNKDPHVIID